MSSSKICMYCKYEDVSKRMSSNDPNYPGEKGEMDYAVWCNFFKKFISGSRRQMEWCDNWEHY